MANIARTIQTLLSCLNFANGYEVSSNDVSKYMESTSYISQVLGEFNFALKCMDLLVLQHYNQGNENNEEHYCSFLVEF
eukprot:6239545-Amphidinium_carterae.3